MLLNVYSETGCQSVVMEIERRRIQWLHRVIRLNQSRIPKVALRWTPPSKRKPGRSKTTRQAELGEVKFI